MYTNAYVNKREAAALVANVFCPFFYRAAKDHDDREIMFKITSSVVSCSSGLMYVCYVCEHERIAADRAIVSCIHSSAILITGLESAVVLFFVYLFIHS